MQWYAGFNQHVHRFIHYLLKQYGEIQRKINSEKINIIEFSKGEIKFCQLSGKKSLSEHKLRVSENFHS